MSQLARNYEGRIRELEAQIEDLKAELDEARRMLRPNIFQIGVFGESNRDHFTRTELTLLELLYSTPGVVTKQALYDRLYWDRPDPPDSKILDVLVCKMRIKIRRFSLPGQILTEWALGYYLSDELRAELKKRNENYDPHT